MQGDGEVCTTAIETALPARRDPPAHRPARLDLPGRRDAGASAITMGMDPDLDTAAKDALRRMVDRCAHKLGLSRHARLMLMSLAADVRVTQLVNDHKGVPRDDLPKTALRQAV